MIFTEKDAEDIYHQVAKDAMKGCYAGDMWEPNVRPADVAKYFNRILAERGRRVWGHLDKDGSITHSKWDAWQPGIEPHKDDTHTAILIDIKPIQRDTAESLLKGGIAIWDSGTVKDIDDWLARVRKFVDASSEKREIR